MKKQLIKIFALALCGVFSLQILLPFFITVGIGVVQFSQQAFISAHEKDDAVFEEIVLNESDYKAALVNAEEISLHGNLFDIHSVSKSGNYYTVKVFADEREDHLAVMNKSFAKEKKDDATTLASLFFSLLYFENFHPALFVPEQTVAYFDKAPMVVPADYFKVPTPPPNALA